MPTDMGNLRARCFSILVTGYAIATPCFHNLCYYSQLADRQPEIFLSNSFDFLSFERAETRLFAFLCLCTKITDVNENVHSSEFPAVLCQMDRSSVGCFFVYSCPVFSHHKHKHYGKLLQVVYIPFCSSLSLYIDLKSPAAECLN